MTAKRIHQFLSVCPQECTPFSPDIRQEGFDAIRHITNFPETWLALDILGSEVQTTSTEHPKMSSSRGTAMVNNLARQQLRSPNLLDAFSLTIADSSFSVFALSVFEKMLLEVHRLKVCIPQRSSDFSTLVHFIYHIVTDYLS